MFTCVRSDAMIGLYIHPRCIKLEPFAPVVKEAAKATQDAKQGAAGECSNVDKAE